MSVPELFHAWPVYSTKWSQIKLNIIFFHAAELTWPSHALSLCPTVQQPLAVPLLGEALSGRDSCEHFWDEFVTKKNPFCTWSP